MKAKYLFSINKKTKVSEEKTPNSRLAKPEKAEFTSVNEHFSGKHNAEVGVFLQTLIILFIFPINYLLSQDTTKVLFLGNSFTYFNNMPDMVKGLADSAGIVSEIEMYAPGGMYV